MEKVDFVSEYITGFPEPCCMRLVLCQDLVQVKMRFSSS